MRKPPKFLEILLSSEDVESKEYRAAAAELERQPHLPPLLEQLAVGDPEWWQEGQTILVESGLPSPSESIGHSITVEVESTLGEDMPVDCEQVSLDFLDPPGHPELLGRLGRYEIERVLGTGGMGVVLRAFDTDLHRVVAIKVLAAHLAHHSSARRRFAREAQAAAAVVHPHVIPIFNVESDAKTPYIVMHYVAGQSLQRRIDVSGPLPIVDALRIAQQTAAGLSAAHAQGLVHRDVKPANILLEEQIDRVLLSDFGLARAVDDASLTKTGIVAGTPHYMSPEQALGDAIDHRSDLFSLGSVLYFMLCGHPPFRASGAMAVLHRICQLPHRPLIEANRDVPIEVSQLVDRLLVKKPRDRIASAAEVESELGHLLASLQQRGLSIQSQPSLLARGRLRIKQQLSTRQKLWAGFAAPGLAVLLLAVALLNPGLRSNLTGFVLGFDDSQRWSGDGEIAGSISQDAASTSDADVPATFQRPDGWAETNQGIIRSGFEAWVVGDESMSREIRSLQERIFQLQQQTHNLPPSADQFQSQCDRIRVQLDALEMEL